MGKNREGKIRKMGGIRRGQTEERKRSRE